MQNWSIYARVRSRGRNSAAMIASALVCAAFVAVAPLAPQPISYDDFSIQPTEEKSFAPPEADRLYDDQRLVEPLEILPGDEVPAGTIARVERDFLICTGPDFFPVGTVGDGTAPGEDATIVDTAAFNNATIESIRRAGLDDREVFVAALQRFEAGLAADPQFLPYLYNAGRIAFQLGDREKAARYFERARGLLPEFAGIHQNLGFVYAAGRPGEREEQAAIASFRRAAASNPFERAAWIALGDTYLEWERPDRAREYYAAVLKEIPASVDAKIGLARIAMGEGRWNDARRLLESAALTYPGDIARRNINRSAHYYLGLVYRKIGAHSEAVQSFDTMLSYPRDALFLRISYRALERLRDQSAATSRASGS
ncbi:MAG: tetratricopeptide repeat protein [bacterium]|nr:tetratricopeptide repeat protein [bacterium]